MSYRKTITAMENNKVKKERYERFSIKQNGGPMNASAIKLSKVSKRYGKRHVLHDVSFEVHQSELCALVGANGAGKSTLIKIVLGLCEPSSGSVELFGGKSKESLA